MRRSTPAARRSDSTNSACAAPRDSASSPSAPEPAHRSSTFAPSSPGSCSSAENSASRTRSDVGRVPRGGTASRRPPATPAMIRTRAPHIARAQVPGSRTSWNLCAGHGSCVRAGWSRGEDEQQVAALDLLDRADRQPVDRGRPACAVIAASIFIASMVATVCPAVDLVALGDLQRDHPGERRGDVVRVGPVGLLRRLDVAWRPTGRAPTPAAAGR